MVWTVRDLISIETISPLFFLSIASRFEFDSYCLELAYFFPFYAAGVTYSISNASSSKAQSALVFVDGPYFLA